jgi:VanZ family protein
VKSPRVLILFWAPAIAWFLVIHGFSSIPGSDLPETGLLHADKIFHAIEYFVLGALLMRALTGSDIKAGLAKSVFLAIIITLSYGAIDELYQRSVPGRSCDFFDFLANCAGSISGIYIFCRKSCKTGE